MLAIAVAALGLAYLAAPRGALSGAVVIAPDSWRFLGGNELCLLETAAPQPRTVRVGCYPVEGDLYVHSHRWTDAPALFGTSWVSEVDKNQLVRVRIREQVYELRVVEVTEPAARTEILSTRGYDPVPQGIRLFRLVAREPIGMPR